MCIPSKFPARSNLSRLLLEPTTRPDKDRALSSILSDSHRPRSDVALTHFPEEKNSMRRALPLFAALFFLGSMALGTVFGTVRGIVHDPQHRPVSDAKVILQAK